MATRAEIIKKAVLAARKDWLKYTVQQERQIYSLLDDAAKEIQRRILSETARGKIPPARLPALLGDPIRPRPGTIRDIMRQLNPKLSGQIKRGMKQSITHGLKSGVLDMAAAGEVPKGAKVSIGTSFIGKDGVVRTHDVRKELYAQSAWARINSDAMDHLVRTQYGGVTLSRRVWDITWEREKAIRNALQRGVLLGDSAAKLSREIRPHLVHPNDRFHKVRKDGKLVWSKPAQAVQRGRGVYKSAYKNAMRLARTEVNRAYHEGQIRYGQQKNWIDGYIWKLGGIGPWKCVCPDWAGRFFTKGNVPQRPHPQCMCWLSWHIKGTPKPEQVKGPVSHKPQGRIPIEYTGDPASDAYRDFVTTTTAGYPRGVQKALREHGTRIEVTGKLTSAYPGLKGKHPRGWPAGTTWDSVSGLHSPSKNAIIVSEKYRLIRQKHYVSEGPKRRLGMLNHEVGHAYDQTYMASKAYATIPAGSYSRTPAFAKAHRDDLKALRKNDLQNMHRRRYFMQKGDAGRSETFAECFAEAAGQQSDIGNEAISSAFPGCYKIVREAMGL